MTDPLLSQRVGRYEIRGLLGRGGMSRVYRALDHNLQREVALKVLDQRLVQGTEFGQRFEREAHTLAALRHPGIVPIYDYGTEDGVTYIAEQLLAGPTLDTELARLNAQNRRMDRSAVLQVIAQLADALDYAHGRGVIHRDLKPSNVIRNERGDVLLTDFGIAVNLDNSLRHTQTGQIIGTPAYLSPEQAQGSPTLTPASDVYALGIILYEMLTGRVPFNSTQPMAVALAHVQDPPPPPRTLRPDLPPAVEQVVLRALAKDPVARYASAGALARALAAAWVAAPPVRPVVPPGVHEQATVVNPPRTSPVTPVPTPPPAPSPRQSQAIPPVPRTPTSTAPRATGTSARVQGRPPSRRGPWIALAVLVLVLGVIGVAVAGILRTPRSPGLPTAVIIEPTGTEALQPTEAPTDLPPTEIAPTDVQPTEVPPTEVPPTAVPPTEVSPTEVPPTEAPPAPTEVPPTEPPLEITPPSGVVIPLPAQIFDIQDVIKEAEGQQLDRGVARQLRSGLQTISTDIQNGDPGAAREEIVKLNKIVDDNSGNGGIKSQVATRLKQLLQSLDDQLAG